VRLLLNGQWHDGDLEAYRRDADGSKGAVGLTVSKHRAAWGDLDSRDTTPVHHNESVTMPTAQDAGILGQGCDDLIDDEVFTGQVWILVSEVHSIAVRHPDSEHDAGHVRHRKGTT
jgi:hypothetical protein